MRAVSDTSPVSNLAIIGRLDLLKQRYGRIRIPPAVEEELRALRHPDGRARVVAALEEGWLVVEAPATPALVMPIPLDSGETEAIALAVGIRAVQELRDLPANQFLT